MQYGAAFPIDTVVMTHCAKAPSRAIALEVDIALTTRLILHPACNRQRAARPGHIVESCLAFIGNNDSYVHSGSLSGASRYGIECFRSAVVPDRPSTTAATPPSIRVYPEPPCDWSKDTNRSASILPPDSTIPTRLSATGILPAKMAAA